MRHVLDPGALLLRRCSITVFLRRGQHDPGYNLAPESPADGVGRYEELMSH
jgi:hypothetical protein